MANSGRVWSMGVKNDFDISEATLLDSQNYILRYSTPTCQSIVL